MRREPTRQWRGDEENAKEERAKRIARQSLGELLDNSRSSSKKSVREWSKKSVRRFDDARGEFLAKQLEDLFATDAVALEALTKLSTEDQAEILNRIRNFKTVNGKTGSDPRDLEARDFTICFTIERIRRLVGMRPEHAFPIVSGVLSKMGIKLEEETVKKTIWQKRMTMGAWRRFVRNMRLEG